MTRRAHESHHRSDAPTSKASATTGYFSCLLHRFQDLPCWMVVGDRVNRNPELIRGAKEWLSRQMPTPYDPIRHQASLLNHST